MTVTHLQPLFHRIALILSLVSLPLGTSWAESKPGYKPRKRAKQKPEAPEKRHDPTALDRRLLPAPVFGATAAPVGGLMVDEAHWNPFDPAAPKHFTINGGKNVGLRSGDRLLVWRGTEQTVVAEVEVVSVRAETAQIVVIRKPNPAKILPLDIEAVVAGDRVSMLMRAPGSIWPEAQKKRKMRRIVRKKKQPANVQKAAEAAPVPPGKDTIIIGGRELPRANTPGVSLTPAQLPEVESSQQAKPEE